MTAVTLRMGRTIRLDKAGIRELAKELEGIVADALEGREGPIGIGSLGQYPFEVRAVDGSRRKLWILLRTIPSRDFRYFVSGGMGTAGKKPALIVNVNGSLDAEVIWKATNARSAHGFLYPILLHELTHAADIFAPPLGLSEDEAHDNPAYYNHPAELRAYMQEVVDELEGRFQYFDKLRGRFGHRGLEMFLNFSSTWKEVGPHWTAASRQKVLKAVYQALEDWRDREAARKVAAVCAMPGRVAQRYLEAKGKAKGQSFVPEYTKALKALEGGDGKPLRALAESIVKLVEGDGKRPEWMAALSTQKMNAVRHVYKGAQVYLMYASSVDSHPELIPSMLRDYGDWAKPLRTLELATALDDKVLEIKRGPFVVVPIPGVTKASADAALEALDEATSKLRTKCPKVLYGKVFFSNHLKKGKAAWYDVGTDTLALNVLAKKRFDDIFTIIHELGHRHEYKFLSSPGKIEYWNLSTMPEYEVIHFDAKLREQMADEFMSLVKLKALGKPMPDMSEALMWWIKSPHPIGDVRRLGGKFVMGEVDEKELRAAVKGKADASVRTDKVIRGPLHVTPYGATKPGENYADGFAHFVLGMDMPAELAAILAEELT